MFLNEEFLKLWEELSELNESKADTQKLVDFAGEDLANRFLAVKSRLKSPENDLYYWIKNKTVGELEQAVSDMENTKSATMLKKDVADKGAELIQETKHWKVYHITTYEASQKYGRDTKWCITGIKDYGDKYWKEYTEEGVKFYFLIAKDNYDPRGLDSKFAVAVVNLPDGKGTRCEIYNQQDDRCVGTEIPHHEEVNIPGVDILAYYGHYCYECNDRLYDDVYDDGYNKGPDGNLYCDDCFMELFFVCDYCEEVFSQDELHEVGLDVACDECFSEMSDDYDSDDWYSL